MIRRNFVSLFHLNFGSGQHFAGLDDDNDEEVLLIIEVTWMGDRALNEPLGSELKFEVFKYYVSKFSLIWSIDVSDTNTTFTSVLLQIF